MLNALIHNTFQVMGEMRECCNTSQHPFNLFWLMFIFVTIIAMMKWLTSIIMTILCFSQKYYQHDFQWQYVLFYATTIHWCGKSCLCTFHMRRIGFHGKIWCLNQFDFSQLRTTISAAKIFYKLLESSYLIHWLCK